MADPIPTATIIPPGFVAIFPFGGEDSATPPHTAAVTGTATVSDYTSAYVAKTSNPGEYILVAKAVLTVGQKIPVSVTFAVTAADGTSLASVSVNFELDGAAPAVATHGVVGNIQVVPAESVTVPSDPGFATITI